MQVKVAVVNNIKLNKGERMNKIKLALASLVLASSSLVAATPTVAITSPTSGASVTGTAFSFQATVSTSVSTAPSIYIDSLKFGTMTDSNGTYSYALNTCNITDGSHTVQVKATSSDGLVGTSSYVSFTSTCASATADSNIILLSPAKADTLSGIADVRSFALSLDNFKQAVLYVDSNPYGRVLTSPPMNFKFPTSALSNGAHSVKIKVISDEGKVYESNTQDIYTENTILTENVSVNIVSPAKDATKAQRFKSTIGVASGETIVRADFYMDSEDIWFHSENLKDNPANQIVANLNLGKYKSGTHTMKVYVETESGSIGTSAPVSFNLLNTCIEGLNCAGGEPMSVKAGWNLVALPVKGMSSKITPFKNHPMVDTVYAYQDTAWKTYSKAGKEELTAINQNTGFWLKALADTEVYISDTMPTIPMIGDGISYQKGWNLIGTSTKDDLLTKTFAYCKSIDSAFVYRDSSWFSYEKGGNDKVVKISPTEGFWVNANSTGRCSSKGDLLTDKVPAKDETAETASSTDGAIPIPTDFTATTDTTKLAKVSTIAGEYTLDKVDIEYSNGVAYKATSSDIKASSLKITSAGDISEKIILSSGYGVYDNGTIRSIDDTHVKIYSTNSNAEFNVEYSYHSNKLIMKTKNKSFTQIAYWKK